MNYATISRAFEATVLLSTAAAVAIGAIRASGASGARLADAPSHLGRSQKGHVTTLVSTLVFHPLSQLVLVCALLYLNQAHHGSTAFISRFIPGSWFAIGTRDPLVLFAAKHAGDGQWLSPTLLRVQAFLERGGGTTHEGPSGVLGLLTFLACAGAISYVVLALYDAFLLYNLAHLPRYASGLALSLCVAMGASFAAPRVDAALAKALGRETLPSPSMDVRISALRTFTILFAVPSLSLRYWGAHPSAVLCGALVIVLAMGGARRPLHSVVDGRPRNAGARPRAGRAFVPRRLNPDVPRGGDRISMDAA